MPSRAERVELFELADEFLERRETPAASTDPATGIVRSAGAVEMLFQALLGAGTIASGTLALSFLLGREAQAAYGFLFDLPSCALFFLVQSLGFATFRFSVRYLDGEANMQMFLRNLASATIAASLLMLASDLKVVFLSWLWMSLSLHKLLLFYSQRGEAFLPAYKKFFISRLGDIFFLSAIIVIYLSFGDLDLYHLQARWSQDNSSQLVAILVVLAALTKSAQFPFHSWLPETMEAPTPVSAFMHAGIINAGGVLLLKFSSLLIQSPVALSILIGVGTFTCAIGLLCQWAQVKIKRALAWSTIAQMGFMMVEIGLGAFGMALIHILGHGYYKAWHFLWSADGEKVNFSLPVGRSRQYLAGIACSLATLASAVFIGLFSGAPTDAELSLLITLALALSSWFLAYDFKNALPRLFLSSIFCLALMHGVHSLGLYGTPQSYPTLPLPIVYLPPFALLFVGVLQQLLVHPTAHPRLFGFRVAALHGFYLGTYADFILGRLLQIVGGKHEQVRTIAE